MVVPTKFGAPGPVIRRLVIGVPEAWNSGTSLALIDVTPPKVRLVTSYLVVQQLFVVDQFGHALNDIYVGTPVYENRAGITDPRINHGFAPINQAIQMAASTRIPWRF